MKWSKRICLVVLVVALCIGFCGCDRLDEMKASHAVWQEDGSILWNGTVYKPLPRRYYDINGNLFSVSVHITEPDVPVLLSEELGDYFHASTDGVFIYGYSKDNEYTNYTREYCRADRYDEVAAELAGAESLDGLCYDYYVGDKRSYKTYYLTVEQQQALNYITTYNYGEELYDLDYVYSADLYYHSPYDLYRESGWSIVSTGDGFYITNGPPYASEWVWAVPDDYKYVVESIIRVGYESEVEANKVMYYE